MENAALHDRKRAVTRKGAGVSIIVKNVSKCFGNHVALEKINLEVPGGSLVALLGPSGSGKTTLLRIIAGLESADHGSVLLHDEDTERLDVRQRNIGFVFQHYALFRHMTVAQNIGFSLKMRRRPKRERHERVQELLKLIQLENLANRYPAQLSGGQRQRVALARALAAQPRVLLLDEPFGALDAKVRKELRDWLRRLHDDIQITSVFVTHDQEEALELADRVVVMSNGRIEQIGTPEEVYHHPANPFVMQFLGQVNLFHARVEGGDHMGPTERKTVVGYVRPHQLHIARHQNGQPTWPARVTRINAAGIQVRVDLLLKNENRNVEVVLSQERFSELALRNGEEVFVNPTELKVFGEADYAI
jgi:sulfate/thiosulfate transport system ATP-binding protein